MVSMDGVMQAPGGPTEDPTKGFKFGGWEMPYFDQEFGEELNRVFKEKFDLLLGRKTYEICAGYWKYYHENPPHGGIAKLFNEIKKYGVSRSGEVIRAGRARCSSATSPTWPILRASTASSVTSA